MQETTRRVVDSIDWEATYLNAFTSFYSGLHERFAVFISLLCNRHSNNSRVVLHNADNHFCRKLRSFAYSLRCTLWSMPNSVYEIFSLTRI